MAPLTEEQMAVRRAHGKSGQAAFNERFQKNHVGWPPASWPPAVSVSIDMLDRQLEDLDKPYLDKLTPQRLRDSDASIKPKTVLVQLMLASHTLLDANDILVNPTLYEVYDQVHALVVRKCNEAIGENPQDPVELLKIDDYIGDAPEGVDLRAVFTVCGPAQEDSQEDSFF